MVGVAEDDFDAEGFERVLGDGFDGALRANGHEDGSFNSLMGQEETATAAAGGGFGEELVGRRHPVILERNRSHRVLLGFAEGRRSLMVAST